MASQKDFDKFLSDIEPSESTEKNIERYHKTLREYLEGHAEFGPHCIKTFLSGSYARHTMVRPSLHDGKRDVDVDVVTNFGFDDSPDDALEQLESVLSERAAYGKTRLQSHSVGIEMEGIGIDVVPLIEDSEEKLYVANSNTDEWDRTDPKGHKSWATKVNKDFDRAFKPLVKIFKWWRQQNAGDEKLPKGITLEKIVADCLPEEHDTTERDLFVAIETIVDKYGDIVDDGKVPVVDDPTVPGNDLAEGYTNNDFKSFVDKLRAHLYLLREDTSNATWRKILGDRFPSGPSGASGMLVKSRYETTLVLHARHKKQPGWSMQRGQKAWISAEVTYPNGVVASLRSESMVLPKRCQLEFKAIYSATLRGCTVYWQVVNTGPEASAVEGGLRGGFDCSNSGAKGRHEETEYVGVHSIQCYVVKGTVCVAKSDPFFVFIE